MVSFEGVCGRVLAPEGRPQGEIDHRSGYLWAELHPSGQFSARGRSPCVRGRASWALYKGERFPVLLRGIAKYKLTFHRYSRLIVYRKQFLGAIMCIS